MVICKSKNFYIICWKTRWTSETINKLYPVIYWKTPMSFIKLTIHTIKSICSPCTINVSNLLKTYISISADIRCTVYPKSGLRNLHFWPRINNYMSIFNATTISLPHLTTKASGIIWFPIITLIKIMNHNLVKANVKKTINHNTYTWTRNTSA